MFIGDDGVLLAFIEHCVGILNLISFSLEAFGFIDIKILSLSLGYKFLTINWPCLKAILDCMVGSTSTIV